MPTLSENLSGLPQRTPSLVAKQPYGVQRTTFLKIVDRAAHDQLKDTLGRACAALNATRAEPAIVATSTLRFNDAGYDHNWQVIRLGDKIHEKSEYLCTNHDAASDISAWSIVKHLEKSSWRQTFSRAFDLGFGDHILALVIQDGLAWLVFSATNHGSEQYVFEIWQDADISYYGDCEDRFDQAVFEKQAQPLKFANAINPPDFWPYSTVSEWHFEVIRKRLALARSAQNLPGLEGPRSKGLAEGNVGYLAILIAFAAALAVGASLLVKLLL